jgi:hypothetical protein
LIVNLSEAGVDVKSIEWGSLYAGVAGIVGILLSCIVRFIEMGYLRILDKAFGFFVDPAGEASSSLSEGVLPYHAVPQEVKEAELEYISVVSRKMKPVE